MALSQKKFREIVFLALYSRDLSESEEQDLIAFLMKELSVSKSSVRQALVRVQLIEDKVKDLDSLIEKHSKSYEFSRIPGVERNILRLALYEILYDEEIPPKVAMAEAIRLARKFTTRDAATFVNAILDAAYKKNDEEIRDE